MTPRNHPTSPSPWPRGSSLLAAALITLSLIACEDDSNVAEIEICGDVQVPEGIDAVRVSILDEAREERGSGVLELLKCPEEEIKLLPQRTEIGLIDGPVWIVAQGLKDGVEVMRFERRAVSDGSLSVLLGLTRDCLGASCPLGQTCIDGACAQAPFETGADICTGTGALPGTTEDAGVTDAETMADVAVETDAGDAGTTEDEPAPLCPGNNDGTAGSPDAGTLDDASQVNP